LLEESGNDDGALESYRRELQVATDDRVRHDAWVRIAMLCDRMGREECADEALTELIALDPADGTAYAQLIDRYVRHEEFAKVQELMANAPDDVQNDVTIHYNIGAGLWNQGDAAAAVPSLERVLELRPDMADAHRLLGFCKVSSSELEEAAEHFARYLELAPDAPDAAATRAVLAQVQEKIANAGN
jgi:tetratricopeptide (TPR) repeat protein